MTPHSSPIHFLTPFHHLFLDSLSHLWQTTAAVLAPPFAPTCVQEIFSLSDSQLPQYITALFCIWLFAFIILRLSHTLRSAFAPLCIIPGISSSSICRWDPQAQPGQRTVQWANYPYLVETQSKAFKHLMETSMEIKKTEVMAQDLMTLVQISNLNAKDSLAEHK